MEFTPRDDTRPRRQARHLRSELAVRGVVLDMPACLDAVAVACGHEGWPAMRRRIGRVPASPLDDETDAATVAARLSRQVSAFEALGLSADDAADVAESVRASARRFGRSELSAGRVTFLDLPCTRLGPMTDAQYALLSESLERERVMNVHRKASGVGTAAYATFLRTLPENVRAVAGHFTDGPYEVTFGLLMMAGTLSRSHEEARLWVATLQEMWRRLGGRTVALGHFAEAFAPGVPTEGGVSEIWARRSAGERSTGIPRFDHPVGEGEIGFMVNGMRRSPYVVTVPADGFDALMERHERMFARAPADPSEDVEANLGLQVELLKENAGKPDGDPGLAGAAGMLLWLALVHPSRGQAVRDAVGQALAKAGRAYVTMTVSETLKVQTSISDAFEDRTRVFTD